MLEIQLTQESAHLINNSLSFHKQLMMEIQVSIPLMSMASDQVAITQQEVLL